jgi:DNA-binding LytR/AlgR family response regulator
MAITTEFIKVKDSLNLRQSMKGVEAQLDRKRFVRIHRSAIVNINRVVELQLMFHGGSELILRNGTRLTIGRCDNEKIAKLHSIRIKRNDTRYVLIRDKNVCYVQDDSELCR